MWCLLLMKTVIGRFDVSVSSTKTRYAPYNLFYFTESGSQEDKILNFSCLIFDEQC